MSVSSRSDRAVRRAVLSGACFRHMPYSFPGVLSTKGGKGPGNFRVGEEAGCLMT